MKKKCLALILSEVVLTLRQSIILGGALAGEGTGQGNGIEKSETVQ